MRKLSRLRGGLRDFFASMTVQISASIALISTALIIASGYVVEAQFIRQLREANELALITRMAFIRDDMRVPDFDVDRDGATLVGLNERRVHRLHAAILDGQRNPMVGSPGFPTLASPLPATVVSAADLSNDMTTMSLDAVRQRYSDRSSIGVTADGRRYRLLLGRVDIPAEGGPDRDLLVALAIETTPSTMFRKDYRRDLLRILLVELAVSITVGVVLARRIVGGAKRLGAAAARIGGASALDARLPLAGTPTELVESTLAFNRMLERLQLSFERLSAFSSDLAHDLRTPINNLMGEAQVALLRTRSADEYRAIIESAVEEYERMSRMIGNMLFLARADNAQAVVAPEWLDLREALERVRSYFDQIAEERGVEIAVSIEASRKEARVWADETMLIRALSNLVSNAVRHATAQTRVEIDARVDDDGDCAIAVSNAGAPIAKETRVRIFDRFYRGDAAREQSSSSSGLGLAIVRSIMDLHRGTATVDDAADGRTTFRLWFPSQATSMRVP